MKLTREDVDEILELLDGSSFDELHLHTGRLKLSLRRNGMGAWSRTEETLAEATLVDTGVVAKTDQTAAEDNRAREVSPDLTEVRSPLPGTFYRSPQPGAPPFIEVGDCISADTVIGIVETMKLMNSVTAGVNGEVVEICAANAESIEKDAPLVRIRPEAAA
jgi:acetyl-CoA carboxylase biotin carboxyl carrier protein